MNMPETEVIALLQRMKDRGCSTVLDRRVGEARATDKAGKTVVLIVQTSEAKKRWVLQFFGWN